MWLSLGEYRTRTELVCQRANFNIVKTSFRIAVREESGLAFIVGLPDSSVNMPCQCNHHCDSSIDQMTE